MIDNPPPKHWSMHLLGLVLADRPGLSLEQATRLRESVVHHADSLWREAFVLGAVEGMRIASAPKVVVVTAEQWESLVANLPERPED